MLRIKDNCELKNSIVYLIVFILNVKLTVYSMFIPIIVQQKIYECSHYICKVDS